MRKLAPCMPQSTYRLQFSAAFGFDDAANLAPYLAALGISHVYASPYLKARSGSTHGYDIVDHAALNPELGDASAFERMNEAFSAHGLRQILDFVPNHMGVGGADNPLWLDVLEWGPNSAVAGWFDINWEPDSAYLADKVLVPFLGDQYGNELAAGKLALRFEDGAFSVWAYDSHRLPVNPREYASILGAEHPVLERLSDQFETLQNRDPHFRRRATELKDQLTRTVEADPSARDALDRALERFRGIAGNLRSWAALDTLIGRQHWRIASFRVAADDINYRRFFNINDLAGIRMELPELFDHAHRRVFKLLDDGVLHGLRIDHVDGLFDPREYLERLRAKMPEPAYLVVEKIIARHELLRDEWPVDGTTGYDFTGSVLGVLIDQNSEGAFSQTYEKFAGSAASFSEIVYGAKIQIMENELASELHALAGEAARIARQHAKTCDFTRHLLQRAIEQTVASFPVYRTYVDGGPLTDADRRDVDWAIAHARRRDGAIDPTVFEFLAALLSGDIVAEARSGYSRQRVLRFAMRFQQFSGPVMAKGLEDTAFYRYNRFVALNEVGGSPEHFGTSLAAFHHANLARVQHWPGAMLATSTHDTKRGEDARARLAVLSELPEEWAQQTTTWSRLLRARRGDLEASAPPDRNDEYLLYQMLVGSWPAELIDGDAPDAEALAGFAERVKASMVKSMREAKVHSTWAAPSEDYESAVLSFIDDALNAEKSRQFFEAFLPFVHRVARFGVDNALAQTVLKLTVPGMPDIYQGSEVWNDSMVDPDNRRPFDFRRLNDLLQTVQAELVSDPMQALQQLYTDPWDGGVKLAITSAILNLRRCEPDLFTHGTYERVETTGDGSGSLCTFIRRHEGKTLLVAVNRFPVRRAGAGPSEAIVLKPEDAAKRWTDRLSGAAHAAGELEAETLFAVLPVAVLTAGPE
jgi:(1->4)-alpha-D-glucan 1-alpha-D-glucosylmutase